MEPDDWSDRLGNVEVIPAEPVPVEDDVAVPPRAASYLSFTDFYRATRDEVARALTLTLGNADLGAEAADEAMARAYQRWSAVAAYDNPTGWVYRVGLNWATSVLRRRNRAPRPLAELAVPGVGAVSEPDVLRAIAELDVRQRAVVVCRFLLGWSVSETANALATPEGTVKSRLHRASAHLATRLAHLRPEEP